MIPSPSALRDLLKELLMGLLKEYSPTGREGPAVNYLRDFIEERLGYDEVVVDHAGNLIASYGEGERVVAFVGHIDTVPGYLPAKVEGDLIRGRGAVDAKGPLAAAVIGAWLAQGRMDRGDLRVVVAALVGEEGDSRGAKHLIREGFRANHLVILEPTGGARVAIEYRGSASLIVKCVANGGHSSNPSASESACDKLIKAWLALKEAFPGVGAGGFSAALTMLRCGEGGTVLPTNGVMEVNVRTPYGVSEGDLLEKLRNVLNGALDECEWVLRSFVEAVRAPINSLTVRALYRALIAEGIRPRLTRKLGTSDMNLLLGKVCGEAAAYGPGDPALAHSNEEYVSLSELTLAARVYANTVLELRSLTARRGR